MMQLTRYGPKPSRHIKPKDPKVPRIDETSSDSRDRRKQEVENTRMIRRAVTMGRTNPTDMVTYFISSHGDTHCDRCEINRITVPPNTKVIYIPTISNIGTVNMTDPDTVKSNYECFQKFIKQISIGTTDEKIGKLFLEMRNSFIVNVFNEMMTLTLKDLNQKLTTMQRGVNVRDATKERVRDVSRWLLTFMNDPNTFRLFIYNGTRDGGRTPGDKMLAKNYTSDLVTNAEPYNWKIVIDFLESKYPSTLQNIANGKDKYNEYYSSVRNIFRVDDKIDVLPLMSAKKRASYPRSDNTGSNTTNTAELLNLASQFAPIIIINDISCCTAIDNDSKDEITNNQRLRELNEKYKVVINEMMGCIETINEDDSPPISYDKTIIGDKNFETYLQEIKINPEIMKVLPENIRNKYYQLLQLMITMTSSGHLDPFLGGSKSKRKSNRKSKRRNNRKTYKKKLRKTYKKRR
jgi:hypothetical protein